MTKKISSLLIVLILLISTIPNLSEVKAKETFTDLGSVSWAEDAIYFLYDRGIINGYGNGLFGPNDKITREQATLMLVRERYPNETSSTKLTFTDVDPNSFYYNAIAVAVDHQLINGYEDNTFSPEAPINRAETAKILALAYELKAEEGSYFFGDLNNLPHTVWAKSYINALASNNISDGYKVTDIYRVYKPERSITRAEFSLMLARILDDKFKPEPDTSVSYLEAKSLVNGLNIYSDPSLISNVLGTLKENQTVKLMTSQALDEITSNEYGSFFDEYEFFYMVDYQGRIAYVPMNSVEIIKSNEPWIGEYGNRAYSGSGAITDLYVYIKTPNYIYFVSHTGNRYDPIGNLSGAEMPWKYKNFYGVAELTSNTSASFNIAGCEATLEIVDSKIRAHQKSEVGSCDFTGLGMYDGEYTEYNNFLQDR